MISLGRPPIESPEPVVKFAAVRLLLALSALVTLAVVHDWPTPLSSARLAPPAEGRRE